MDKKQGNSSLHRRNSQQIHPKDSKDSYDKLKQYYHFMKQQRNLERLKSKEQQQRRVSLQQKNRKKQIKEELKKKKEQLSRLRSKDQIQKSEAKAFQQAAIKQQQLQQKRKKKNDSKAKNQQISKKRFNNALKWLQIDKENLNFVKNQAQYRRKTGKQWQSMERTKVTIYNEEQQKNKNKQTLQNQHKKQNFEQFKQTLGTNAYKMMYLKQKQNTLPSEPLIQQSDQIYQLNSVVRASEMINKKKKFKEQANDINQIKSKEREQSAQNKEKLKKHQAQYVEECKRKAIEYNMMKIAIGKVNQFAGIKPQTLNQMQINKQLRSEIQFEKIFLKSSTLSKNKLNANKYDVIEARNAETICFQSGNNINKVKTNSIKSNGTTLIPCYSQGKYSFESERIENNI